MLKQAELIGQKANAQRLDNMMKECDVSHKRMITRNKTKGTLESKFGRTFDVISFNQQLADIRSELEQKALMQRTRIGDPTTEMNALLEKFARQSIDVSRISAMKTELTSEQLDAMFMTDGANTFSGKTGKTKLEAFRWPFLIQRKDFQEERDAFDVQCNKVVEEIDSNGSPSPEAIVDLLEKAAAIEKKIDAIPMSENRNVRSVESKWQKEAKAFIRELTQTLGNCSKLDSEKLLKYAFQGKTLGELITHLNSNGLRFSHPGQQDSNLYASIFFTMRYAYQEFEKDPNGTASIASREVTKAPTDAAKQTTDEEGDSPQPFGVRWLNTSYDNTIVRVGDSMWIETDNKTGKTNWHFTEVARTRQYVELKRREVEPNRSVDYRIFVSHMDVKKGDRWEWVSNGHWETSSQLTPTKPTFIPAALKQTLARVEVTSASFGSHKKTEIIINGQVVRPSAGTVGRGLFVVAIVEKKIVLNHVYDCLGYLVAADQFADAIAQLPEGAIVILAVNDEATQNFNANAQKAIVSIGGKIGLLGKPFRSAYYCIGQKGIREGMAVEAIGQKDIHYSAKNSLTSTDE